MRINEVIQGLPLIALLAGAALAPVAAGAETPPVAPKPSAALKVGDPAPKIRNGRWIQGEPVRAFDGEHAYLLEFWATWCGPCKAVIPHLNDLHEKFKDRGLVIIGQNVWEKSESAVGPFVKQMGVKMAYPVALDDLSGGGRGRMADTWLAAAGQPGIPASFLVNKQGIVVWIGHPMQLQESMVEAVLAGKFDAAQAVAAEKEGAAARAALARLHREVYDALGASNWVETDAAIKALERALPENQRYRAGLLRVESFLAQGKQEAGAVMAEQVAFENRDNISVQQYLSGQLSLVAGPMPATLAVAERLANMANAALGGNDINSLMTLARVYFLQGDQSRAVECQAKVVELSKPSARPWMEEVLNSYKAGKLPKMGKNPPPGKNRPRDVDQSGRAITGTEVAPRLASMRPVIIPIPESPI